MPRGWYGTTGICAECGAEFVRRSRATQIVCSRSCAAKRNTGPRNMPRTPLAERFARYLPEERTEDGCWEWTGARDHNSYGRLSAPGKHGGVLKAHRVSYELHHGPIPDGLGVLHRCDNPPCVNPAHLYAGDQAQNADDMLSRGREARLIGAENPRTKVPDEVVRELRERAATGASASALALEYGLRVNYVHAILAGERRLAAGGPLRPLRSAA